MKNKTTHTDTYLNNHLKSITDSFDFACVQNISPAKNDIALSYIVICKNSQSTIERCLNSIYKNMTARDELIVLDTGSTDRTVQLIEKTVPKVRILVTNWTNDFARARNIALKSASKDWFFFVDSDEWLDSEDGTSLEAIIKKAQTKNLISLLIQHFPIVRDKYIKLLVVFSRQMRPFIIMRKFGSVKNLV